MGRTALIAGVWFAFWMIIGGAIVGFVSPSHDIPPHIYQGVMSGAFLAALTSFAWPWILPRIIDRWMSRGEAGET